MVYVLKLIQRSFFIKLIAIISHYEECITQGRIFIFIEWRLDYFIQNKNMDNERQYRINSELFSV